MVYLLVGLLQSNVNNYNFYCTTLSKPTLTFMSENTCLDKYLHACTRLNVKPYANYSWVKVNSLIKPSNKVIMV